MEELYLTDGFEESYPKLIETYPRPARESPLQPGRFTLKPSGGNARRFGGVLSGTSTKLALLGEANDEQELTVVHGLARNLHQRSIVLVDQLDRSHRQLLLYWTMAASFACGLRLSAGAFASLPLPAQISTALPYVLVVGAPIVSALLAFHWFRDGDRLPQPQFRLARYGRWRSVSLAEAKALPYYGVTGIMASLLLGMLIHIPVRTFEFLAAMPALGAAAPTWFGSLYVLFLADCVLLTSLLAIAFVAALRRVPLFPRLLLAIWCIDIAMQLVIASVMGGMHDLPAEVAGALEPLLSGNLKKVLISFALWAPYLLLSKRVNLTFRHRVPVAR